MLFLAALLGPQDSDLPPIPREFRAAWVATVDNIDWPSKRDLPAKTQQSEMIAILDKLVALRMNALVFQVRPAADALYDSKIEPWSEYLSGKQGKSPGYDPLAFTVKEAHERGLEVHVWFNPYRVKHPSAKGQLAPNHVAMTNPKAVKTYGNLQWMDPGSAFTKKRTLQVIVDVVRRYDIDGVHIDDYFYPYPVKGKPFPDDSSYQSYRKKGGKLGRADWRRLNVDGFVHDFYRDVKMTKPWVKVGISPFGIYRPGVPAGIKAGIDQYAELYADAKKWLSEGWCDYMSPQLYWPVNQTAQSYPALLDWWVGANRLDRHIWPGNFTSRTNPSDGNWPASELQDQIKITREKAGGNVHFSMKALMRDWNGIAKGLATVYDAPAAVPETPWLPGKVPGKVVVQTESAADVPASEKRIWMKWDSVPDAHIYGVARQDANGWKWVSFQTSRTASVRGALGAAVVALGRTGRAGVATILEFRK